MITKEEILKGQAVSEEIEKEIDSILAKMNIVRTLIGRPMFVTSGYRSTEYNKQIGGARNSKHTKGQAIDILDTDGRIFKWCKSNEGVLRQIGLWVENRQGPWVHFQSVPYRTYKTNKSIFFNP